ncbi:hypothetical protein ACFRQM_09420 [Streptomyces sp. NPDC056831]|uniref:hypothetical protein n=1 Tax=Streptomyces sp. NPDC056831 TaxID=3345954 RepID=UPI0036B6F58F
MAEITAAMQETANVVPARCGKGKVVHYATVGRTQLGTLCGYRANGGDQPLADAEAAKMGKECTRCVNAVSRLLAAGAPAVEAPASAAEVAPACCVHGRVERTGDCTSPAAACATKAPGAGVGVLCAEGCVITYDCAVLASDEARRLDVVDGHLSDAAHPLYWWAVTSEVEEQPATVSGVKARATDEEATADAPAQEPARYLADYDIAHTDEGRRVHRLTVTRHGSTDPELTRDLPYGTERNAARTLEFLGWEITGMETYGGPNLFRAWVKPIPVQAPADSDLPFHGPDTWVGLHALCGYDDHTAPLDSPGQAAVHERRRGVMGSCPGSLRPVRTHKGQPTSRHTAALSYTGPKPSGLAYWAKRGDVIQVDGQDLMVEDCRPDQRHPSRVNVILTGCACPVTYTVEDEATFRRRIRRHNVECQGCGVYAPVETDEAVDGRPTVRLCGMCDREAAEAPAAPMLMPDQARGVVTQTCPSAHDFRSSYDAALRFLGYTFQATHGTPARYGWVTAAGTYSRATELTRSGAQELLPAMLLDDQRVAARAAAREERPALSATGDRIVCADGVTRTVQAMAPRLTGEPDRVIVEGGAQWIAADCTPVPRDEERQPARRVVEGVVVQHAGTAQGSAPKHADHPDVTGARAALRTLLAANLGEHTELDGSEPDVRGYVIDPRGQGRVAVYWAEGGRLVRHDDAEFGVSLDCLEWTLQRAGWETERMTRSGRGLFAHNPAARPAGD